MKRIFNKLKTLFPNADHILIQHEINSNEEKYNVYISIEPRIWQYNWSSDFSTLKQLEDYLKEKIEGYK